MMEITAPRFSLDGREFPPDKPVANIFAFVSLMAVVVADRRGGRPSGYLKECSDFMVDVVGTRLSASDVLPDDYDWRPVAAHEAALAMMEYDHG